MDLKKYKYAKSCISKKKVNREDPQIYGGDHLWININIDDMSWEIYSYIYDRALSEGALDVYTQSIYMKKNRPAINFL